MNRTSKRKGDLFMKKLTYTTVLKGLGAFLLFLLADAAVTSAPLSLAFFTALCLTVTAPVGTTLLYTAYCIILKPLPQAIATTAGALFLCVIFSVYRRKKKRMAFELALYAAIALTPFIIISDREKLLENLIYCGITAILSFVLQPAMRLCFIKRFTKKGEPHELVALSITVVYLSLGAISLTSYKLWYDVALICMLFSCYYLKSTRAFIPAFVLPVALAIYTQSLEIIAVFSIYCAAVLVFSKVSRLLSALCLFLTTLIFNYFNGGFFVFETVDYIYLFLPVAVFLFTPNKIYELFLEHVLKFEEPQITREIINAERGALSAKLYGVADAFMNLESTLNKAGEKLEPNDYCEKITDDAIECVCNRCEKNKVCHSRSSKMPIIIEKTVKTGISKGNLTLADLPKELSEQCIKINDLTYEINRLIGLLRLRQEENERALASKSLVSMQAGGLSDTIRELAYSLADKVYFGRKNERKLFDCLAYEGIVCRQILRAGNDYHILFDNDKKDYSVVCALLGECEKQKYRLYSKTDVGGGVLTVFKRSPTFDATFGLTQKTKYDSEVSGDNFSLKRIDEGKFMVALCDGMGSGKKANENSLTVISLIENFFAAGLDREVALSITARLASCCFDEGFSTLDGGIVNLYTGECNLIKIGATFGFIIGKDGAQIIENNSLPLGVLDQIEPTLKTVNLSDGDSLVIISDGVSDAFFSSTDAVDFLTREYCANPQTYADKIMNFALSLTENSAKDDMTVLVVRVYKTAS